MHTNMNSFMLNFDNLNNKKKHDFMIICIFLRLYIPIFYIHRPRIIITIFHLITIRYSFLFIKEFIEILIF